MSKRLKRQRRRREQALQIAFDIEKVHVNGFRRPLLRLHRTIRQTRQTQRLRDIRHGGFGRLYARITVEYFRNFKHTHAALRARQIGFQIVHQRADQLRAHHRQRRGNRVEQFNRHLLRHSKITLQRGIDEAVVHHLLIIHRHQCIAYRVRRTHRLGAVQHRQARQRCVGRNVVVTEQANNLLDQILFDRHVKAIRRRLNVQHLAVWRVFALNLQL